MRVGDVAGKRLADIAGHVIRSRLTHPRHEGSLCGSMTWRAIFAQALVCGNTAAMMGETWLGQHFEIVVWPDTHSSARDRIPCASCNEDSKCGSMTWRAMGLANIARHVIGCHSIHETRVQNAW